MTSPAPRDRLPVVIGARNYAIDVTGYQREPVESIRQATDQGVEPGEQSLSNDGIWKRTSDDFVLGAGQEYFDLIHESDRRRFRYSQGIHCWDRRKLKLQNKTRQPTQNGATGPQSNGVAITHAATNQRLIATNIGTPPTVTQRLYYSTGGRIYKITDPTLASWALTEVTGGSFPFGTNLSSIVTDGRYLYSCNGSGVNAIHRTDNVTGAAFGAETADVLGYASGRLLAGAGAALFELSAAGARTNIYTHFSATFRWTAIVGANNGIYCGGNNGRHGEIFLCTVSDQTGAINAPYPAGQLPTGENLNAMAWYAGVLILGTSKGVPVGITTGSGFISYGPLLKYTDYDRANLLNANITDAATSLVLTDSTNPHVPSVGDYIWIESEAILVGAVSGTTLSSLSRGQLGTTAAAHTATTPVVLAPEAASVDSFDCQGQFVWFGWRNLDSSKTGLGRLDLSRFINEQPLAAHASDIMAPFQQGSPSSPVVFTDTAGVDYHFFVVQGNGPWAEYNEKTNTGEYRSGRITYGTPEKKAFVSLEVWTEPLPAGASVAYTVVDSAGVEHSAGTLSATNGRQSKAAIAGSVEDEWVEVRLVLTRGTDVTKGPEVHRWTLRAVPMPFRSERILLPVLIEADVRDEDQTIGMDPFGDWTYLHDLMLDRSRVTLVMGDETVTCLVESIEIARGDPKEVAPVDWNDDRSWLNATWAVTLLTVDGGE